MVTLVINGFHANVWRNFNEKQVIFNALSGSSSKVLVTPIGGNRMYYALWEQHAFITLVKQIVALSKSASATYCWHYRVLQLVPFFLVSALKLYSASKMHAIPIERNTFGSHLWARQEPSRNFLKEHWKNTFTHSRGFVESIYMYR